MPQLTDRQIRDAERDKVYVFNVSPRTFQDHINGKMRFIPACADGAEVSEPLVIDGVEYTSYCSKVDGLRKEFAWHVEDGIKIAQDLIGTAPFKDRSQDLTKFGVFISMSPVPSQEAIDAATAHWIDTNEAIVTEADQLATINNGVVDIGGGRTASNIGPQHREALKVLGLERPWSGVNKRMVLCDECGTSNLPTAARCKNPECWAIFDEAKCRAKFPAMFSHEAEEPVKRGPGRPKREEVA